MGIAATCFEGALLSFATECARSVPGVCSTATEAWGAISYALVDQPAGRSRLGKACPAQRQVETTFRALLHGDWIERGAAAARACR